MKILLVDNDKSDLIKPLASFHGKIVSTFDTLPQNGKIYEIAKRIITIIIAPLAYPVLGALALLGLALRPKRIELLPEYDELGQKIQSLFSSNESFTNPQLSKEITTLLPTDFYSNIFVDDQTVDLGSGKKDYKLVILQPINRRGELCFYLDKQN